MERRYEENTFNYVQDALSEFQSDISMYGGRTLTLEEMKETVNEMKEHCNCRKADLDEYKQNPDEEMNQTFEVSIFGDNNTVYSIVLECSHCNTVIADTEIIGIEFPNNDEEGANE